ncbi:Deoxyribonucleoside regulator DeoR (transcriptional repressor) [Olavius sp. associated proteobacterium Delta 1]|nr:Deoxyribonucleoside regulator DeoR (transcriptional repressor) [Olavius sp. associated proteobacterium Delta 1]
MFIFHQGGENEQMNEMTGRFSHSDLVSRIAWLYFIKGFTQLQISQRLNISRMQVQRSLSKSKKEGLVRIQINDPRTTCFEIEDDLKSRFSLVDAVVVPTPREKNGIKSALGYAAAAYLLRHVSDNQIIGVGWGTTLDKMSRFISGKSRQNIRIVSLVGGSGKKAEESPYEVAFKFADALKAPCYYISAPAIVDSPASRSILIEEKSVNHTLNIAKSSDLAILGIGNADEDSTLIEAGLLSSQEIKKLRAKGAVGDICAHFYSLQGQPVDQGYMNRVIGLGLQDLRKIKTVIGIAGGKNKVAAIFGALTGGLVDVLVTDEQAAENILR